MTGSSSNDWPPPNESEGVDDLLDRLPRGLRNKVLAHLIKTNAPLGPVESLSGHERGLSAPLSYPKKVAYGILMVAEFVFAAPFMIVGIVLCATLIGIPYGGILMGIGTYPLRKTITHLVTRKYKHPKE